MASQWRSTWVYWLLFSGWLVLGAAFMSVTDPAELHLTFNSLNVLGSDSFFLLANNLGDRRVAWAIGLLLCFKRVRQGVAVLAASIVAGLATEALKYGVFGPVPRPVAYFGEPTPLYLVPGFENHRDYSMPSGHAAIAFALFTALALQSRSRLLQAACFACAAITAYGRVYLSEHFFEDVYAGSLLGVACALLAHAVVRPRREAQAPAPEVPVQTDAALQ